MNWLALTLLLVGSLLMEMGYAPLRSRKAESYLWLFGGLMALWGISAWVTGRPLFCALLLLGAEAGLLLFHRVKLYSLREGLTFADLFLGKQALRHPELYFSFLPRWLRWTLLLMAGLLLFAVLSLEHAELEWPSMALRFALVVLACRFCVWPMLNARLPAYWAVRMTGVTIRDQRHYGGLVSLLAYGFARRLRQPETSASQLPQRLVLPGLRKERLPHLIAVQSESFHDLRRWHLPDLPPDLYQPWDALKSRSSLHGLAEVPAFGANTMRAEFAFLTGIPFEAQGLERYNPYLAAFREDASIPMPSLFRQLRQLGYRSLCLHPFDGDFFQRRRVLHRLGLEEMQDEQAFAGAERIGPYISDAALTEAMHRALDAATTPLFLFAITMENHGPWMRGRLGSADAGLPSYLHHLRHAETMLASLMARDDASGCWYGDHAPSFPKHAPPPADQARHDEPVDFLIWGSDKREASPVRLAIESLSARWLRQTGLSEE